MTLRSFLFIALLSPFALHASFIEATIGTAVVNDATATYHNPAALTLLKNPQMVGLGFFAKFRTNFSGQARQALTGISQFGNSSNQTNYYLPSFYLGIPVTDKITAGFAIISNFFNRELDAGSILRYAQSSNQIKNIDLVPAIGIKLTDYFSIGGGINFSQANFLLKPISGARSINIPDSQSINESKGNSWGGDVGFLLKPKESTLIGFNYRSSNTYPESGTSLLLSNPPIISNNYHFKFWTPARSVLSINQFLTPKLGVIGTIQRVQWSIIKTVTVYGVATQIGSKPTIVAKASIPYYLHDTWLLTLGSHYRINKKCIIRVAGTYDQSPGNGNYKISNGDNIILGGSIGYDLNKHLTIDASYAHGFVHKANIHIAAGMNLDGVNKASRDAISIKLTVKA